MNANYYDRKTITYLDGTKGFCTPEDKRSEHEVAKIIEEAWGCAMVCWPHFHPIDWYSERHGMMTGVAELKTRSHPLARYPTVFLNVRKHHALQDASRWYRVPACFFVRFTDGLKWIPIDQVDASKHKIGGCVKTVKSRSDIEPVIEIPVCDLRDVLKREDDS